MERFEAHNDDQEAAGEKYMHHLPQSGFLFFGKVRPFLKAQYIDAEGCGEGSYSTIGAGIACRHQTQHEQD